MKEENSLSAVVSETNSSDANHSSTEEDVQRHWQGVVKRRSFLKGLGMASAALSAGTLLASKGAAQTSSNTSRLSTGDVALLQFALWAELVESDLWTQYAELGGVGPSGGEAQANAEFQAFIGGNPAYNLALQNLDGDMPQYITDNTDDELSHAAFLNAYLMARGAEPVNLDEFRRLPSTGASGARQVGRLTNLQKLIVDTSFYTRYRSEANPDLGAPARQAVNIVNEPAIPLNDTETPPNTEQPVPPTTSSRAARAYTPR